MSYWNSVGTVTSDFGNRNTGIPGASTNHKGIDVVLDNDNVGAVVGGTVINKGTSGSAGNWIKIQQTDGYVATYMHLAKLPGLAVGSSVSTGDIIGVQGSTGISSGKHLHYQIQDSFGNYVDPIVYDENGVNSSMLGVSLDAVSTDSAFDQKTTMIGTIVKVCTLILVGVLAGFLFMKAFDIKLF